MLFSYTDAEAEAAQRYEFWDGGAGGGFFRVSGIGQGASQAIPVLAAQLASLEYVGAGGVSSETRWVRANDGAGWSEWASLTARTLATANAVPAANAAIRNIDLNQWRRPDELFGLSDANGDAATQYRIRDTTTTTTTTANSGYLWIAGVEPAAGTLYSFSAATLANAWVRGGAVAGADTYQLEGAHRPAPCCRPSSTPLSRRSTRGSASLSALHSRVMPASFATSSGFAETFVQAGRRYPAEH